MPQYPNFFEPSASTDWIAVDRQWFQRLAAVDVFSLAERVHLARVALQQQWICDVWDTKANRDELAAFGLHIATTNLGYLIVSGSPTLAEYVNFRNRELSTIEAGILYGYPPSAVVAFAGVVPHVPPESSWMATATYFLGGAYSRDNSDRERQFFAQQWEELSLHAPDVCRLAEVEFQSIETAKAA